MKGTEREREWWRCQRKMNRFQGQAVNGKRGRKTNGWRGGQVKRTDRGRVGGGEKIDESLGKKDKRERKGQVEVERERRGANDG